MSLNRLACAISARFSDALASPFALPVYIAARVVAWLFLTPEQIMVILSDAAMLCLILLAVEQSRQGKAVERGVMAQIEADPRIDEATIRDDP